MSENELKELVLNELRVKNELKLKKLRKKILAKFEVIRPNDDKEVLEEVFDDTLDLLLETHEIKLKGESVILVTELICNSETKTVIDDKKRKRENGEDEIEQVELDVINHVKGNTKNKRNDSDDIDDHNTTILLFYAYCDPPMDRKQQDDAVAFCHSTLKKYECSGRLRVGKEGYNGTLTGPQVGIRAFTNQLRKFDHNTFHATDFKYVDKQSNKQRLKELKVFPVKEIVTYGFNPDDAPLDKRGIHLKPEEFHQALENPNSIVIDVRNFNETLIGKFAPPTADGTSKVLDPCMRRSTEFPQWIEDNKHKFEGKQVLMYCTAGVRCERASAFMKNKGVENVYQLEGGIHRYLEAFPEDGGHWIGAERSETISTCVYCNCLWDRYQAQRSCSKCQMEVLLCKQCQKNDPPNRSLICPLCK